MNVIVMWFMGYLPSSNEKVSTSCITLLSGKHLSSIQTLYHNFFLNLRQIKKKYIFLTNYPPHLYGAQETWLSESKCNMHTKIQPLLWKIQPYTRPTSVITNGIIWLIAIQKQLELLDCITAHKCVHNYVLF